MPILDVPVTDARQNFWQYNQTYKNRDTPQHQRDGRERKKVTLGPPAAVSKRRQGWTLVHQWPPVRGPGIPESAVPTP